MSEILIRPEPRHKIKSEDRESVLQRVAETLKGRVIEAYIFGSFMSEKFSDQSDLDLILIVSTETPFTERGKYFLDLTDLPIPIDLLVYTPEEFQQLIAEPTLGFWQSVSETIRRIL